MNQTLAYLMTDSGVLVQLKSNNILQNFKSYNILLFYSANSRNLYNWIGNKANQALLDHIKHVEQLILKMHPEMMVLRHITVKENDRNALLGFLEDIGIGIEEYKERIRLWHEFEISIYSDIQKLKIAENNHLMLNKLDEAIEVSTKIIDLAKQIHDHSLVEEKTQLIKEAQEKLEVNTEKNNALAEIEQLIPKLKKSITMEDMENAVSLYNQITLIYKSINESPSFIHEEILRSYEEFYSKWEKELAN